VGDTSGAGIAYPSGALELTPDFYWGSCCSILSLTIKKHFDDTKEINRRRTNTKIVKRKRKTGQVIIYKTLHRKLRIEQHEPQ
jgi:hypothetical protein